MSKFEHSVECQASRDFAWKFWTDVDNWAVVDTSVEWVKLDGPFAAGTGGTSKPRGSDPINWALAEVEEGKGAVIEVPLPGALVRFHWLFEDSVDGGVRMTQTVTLDGERANDYAGGMAVLEKGIPQGMQKLAEGIAKAASTAA